jgi:hypothetical protein
MTDQCMGLHRNPAYQPDDGEPMLLMCQQKAVITLEFIGDDGDTYIKKVCPACLARSKEVAASAGSKLVREV